MGKSHTSLFKIISATALCLTGLLVTAPASTALADTGGTFGIDVSTPQAGINFQQAKQEGTGFAIVKMGGDNVSPEYVAPDYAKQIDSARNAGLDIGHYYVPGKGQTPTQQADFMASNLHNLHKNHDVLALDDEVLNSNGTFFTDTNAAQFFTELMKQTGVPANHLWFYVDANNAHTKGPWTQVQKLGVKIWWASYGNEPTGHTPTTQPQLDGAFPKADIHQFTDKSTIADTTVDGDYTTEPLTQLFDPATPAPAPAAAKPATPAPAAAASPNTTKPAPPANTPNTTPQTSTPPSANTSTSASTTPNNWVNPFLPPVLGLAAELFHL